MEAVEQASAENLLGGIVIVGGHVGFDILLPVFGLRTKLSVSANTLAEPMRKRKGSKGKYTDSRGEGGEELLIDGSGLVDGEQLKLMIGLHCGLGEIQLKGSRAE